MTPPDVTPEVTETAAPDAVAAHPFELSWDKTTTPLEALERSLYALADQLTGSISDSGRAWVLMIHPRGVHAERQMLEHRLRQEVNDQVLRVRIAERTDPIRNLIFALAFSRSGLAPDSGLSASEEGHS